jgi:anti-anti-sigma factor
MTLKGYFFVSVINRDKAFNSKGKRCAMIISTSFESGVTQVILNGDLTIVSVAEVRDVLLSLMEQSAAIVVNTDLMSTVDITGIQLFCSLHQSCQNRGIDLRFSGNCSESVMNRLELAGLTGAAGCDRARCGLLEMFGGSCD